MGKVTRTRGPYTVVSKKGRALKKFRKKSSANRYARKRGAYVSASYYYKA